MTRNQNLDCRESVAKVIYKKSMNTLQTCSKTYSEASQIYTRSLLLQLKRNLPKDKYYKENGTVKRDLSIETDICILRRYYKKRRHRLFNREAMSAKTKYSVNQTEIDTINEFNHDTSACGDSEQNVNLNKHLNINLTSLVIDNLKDLLNDWVKTYLLEKRETKEKLDSVLDSIMHKLELQTKEQDTSSSCTYTVDIEVARHNQNPKTNLPSSCLRDATTKLTEHTSVLSIPLNGKYLRIISTLSLPRHAQKTERGRKSRHNMKRMRHKKILLSMSKSSNYIFQSSNLKFLTLPTKSFTKKCATYNHDTNIKVKNYIIPKSSTDTNDFIINSTCQENTFNYNTKASRTCSNSNTVKSFYENIYNDTNHVKYSNKINYDAEREVSSNDINHIEVECKSPNEDDQSDPLITIDLITQSFESHDRNKRSNFKGPHRTKNLKPKCRASNKCKKNVSKFQNCKNINTKQFNYLFRKSNSPEKPLLKHLQSLIKYFSNWEGKKDINFDIQVNVFPSQGSEKDDSVELEKTKNKSAHRDILVYSDNQTIKLANTVKLNATSNDKQNIISLLDGAASQVKYIISRETSTDTSETNNKVEHEKNALDIKYSIAQEISELKIIIKSLGIAAEKLANDHLRKQNVVKENLSISNCCYTNKPAMKTVKTSISNIIKPSKSIQFSSTPKSDMMSGIKIKKEPRNKKPSFNPRLVKKNTSYKIIDSESILKVTDMTSAAQGCTEAVIDVGLTCSLPLSKSLFEVSTEPDKKKLLAFYCDDVVKPSERVCNMCQHHKPYCSIPRGNGCQRIKPFYIISKCDQDYEPCPGEPNFVCTQCTPTNDDYEICDNSSSSICIDIDSKSFDKKLSIRHNTGMGFWEGCFYCAILWIPLLLVSWLFYVHVIKDLITPKHNLLRKFSLAERFKMNAPSTSFPIPLADLGF